MKLCMSAAGTIRPSYMSAMRMPQLVLARTISAHERNAYLQRRAPRTRALGEHWYIGEAADSELRVRVVLGKRASGV